MRCDGHLCAGSGGLGASRTQRGEPGELASRLANRQGEGSMSQSWWEPTPPWAQTSSFCPCRSVLLPASTMPWPLPVVSSVENVERKRISLGRHPERGRDDRALIAAILDEALICHVGFVVDGYPAVI